MFVLEMEPVTALFSNPSNQLSDDPVFFAMLHGWPGLKKASVRAESGVFITRNGVQHVRSPGQQS